ncbi:MAG: hypothetical protein QOD92_3254 [Acidimicrobiaceae bacterium]|jgi:probable F420-dependent oxidoreductase
MTVPLQDSSIEQYPGQATRIAGLGYSDVWSFESNGVDVFSPLAIAAVVAPTVRLGTAIVSIFSRGPACLAQSAATIAAIAPGRFVLGLGTSSNIITEHWNDACFERPYQRMRDMLRFLRSAFTGELIDEDYGTFRMKRFRLGVVPTIAPPILIAALRPGMLRLAGRQADGAIVNWLSADDVSTVVPLVHEGGADKEIVGRIMVAPTSDTDLVHDMGRRMLATYFNVPVYREYQRWLGREDVLAEMWARWDAGDRLAAAAAVPLSVVDDMFVHGTPDQCRRGIQRYVDNGVTTPVLNVFPMGRSVAEAIEELAPQR